MDFSSGGKYTMTCHVPDVFKDNTNCVKFLLINESILTFKKELLFLPEVSTLCPIHG
jgi:hypothetical protein